MPSMSQPHVVPPTATLSRLDREIIELILSWAPYGDPPDDDLITRFGMDCSRLKSHVRQLLERNIDADAHPVDRTLIVRVAKVLGHEVRLSPSPVAVVG
jgi:hypothetical protein